MEAISRSAVVAAPDAQLRPFVRLDGANVEVAGAWTLSGLSAENASIQRQLRSLNKPGVHWDLHGVVALDEIGRASCRERV